MFWPFKKNKEVKEEIKEELIIIKPILKPLIKTHCDLCKTKLTWDNRFVCKYCKKTFCGKHRVPENHNCSGNLKNPYKL